MSSEPTLAESRTPPAGRSPAGPGPLLAVGAYLLWGVFPLYFKAVAGVAPLQVLAHRVVWALAVLSLMIVVLRRADAVATTFADRRRLATLFFAATLLAVNWGVFIHAVVGARVLEASLGYFINPLVSVVLGVIVLGERLRPAGWLAVALATSGVIIELLVVGTLPWVTLVLALSFAGYGLMHKLAPTDAFVALFTETALLAPVAFVYLFAVAFTGAGAFGRIDASTDALLIMAGPVTALPLVLFVAAARRISLVTLGLIQYVTPTLHFLLAIFVFGEPIIAGRWGAFGLIWVALAVYTIDAVRGRPPPAER